MLGSAKMHIQYLMHQLASERCLVWHPHIAVLADASQAVIVVMQMSSMVFAWSQNTLL